MWRGSLVNASGKGYLIFSKYREKKNGEFGHFRKRRISGDSQ